MSTGEDSQLLEKKELEETKQALYDCRRQVSAYQALEKEYQEEIKLLEQKGNSENQQLKMRIQQLEETNLQLKTSYDERNCYLEKELEAKDHEIEELKKEINAIIKVSGEEVEENEEQDDTIFILKEKNCELSQKVEELEQSCEDLGKQNLELQKAIMKQTEELANYVETLNVKRTELEEAKTLIQTLKDDYICLKSELDTIKSKPLDMQSQGNSLFAEVDDRRVQLQQNMNTLKSKYIEMKREHTSHLKQITSLRNDNALLLARLEAEVEEEKCDQNMVLESYKNQIKILNELIESYKKKLQEKSNSQVSTSTGIQFIDKMIAEKNKEVEEWKEKYSARSLNQSILSHDLAAARKEIRKYKLQILKLQNEMEEMKLSMDELKRNSELKMNSDIKQLPQEIKDEIPKSIMKNESEKVENGDKENARKVNFADDVEKPEISEKVTMRRGGHKILLSKPVHISNYLTKNQLS